MGSWAEKLGFLRRGPLTYIEIIIALSVLVGGLYILSPFLVVHISLADAPSLIQDLASTTGILILGIVAILNGIAMLYGIFAYRYKIRSAALFFNLLLRLYVVIATIAAQGIFPMDWLSNAVIMAVSAVCYLHLRTTMKMLDVVKT